MAQNQFNIKALYKKAEQFVENNQRLVNIVLGGIVVIVGGYFAYQKLYLAPREQQAQEQMFMAQRYFSQDSLRLAIRGDGNYPGFETIIDQYSGTPAANLSHYYLGISYLRMGDYQKAIKNLQAFESEDIFLSAISLGALGDAYMELGKTEEALRHYKKAAQHNENELTTPVYLFKAGMTCEELGKYKEAKELFKTIKLDYPDADEAKQIEKYIARVDAKI